MVSVERQLTHQQQWAQSSMYWTGNVLRNHVYSTCTSKWVCLECDHVTIMHIILYITVSLFQQVVHGTLYIKVGVI